MSATSLVQSLYAGPLDIVGDVHGEMEALLSLLHHLGYQLDGRHPHDRRLVFVGDLTDRGPDSPAVVDFVTHLIESGRAQCVLGNHDLNILLDHRKPENKWYWGEEFVDERGAVAPQRLADDDVRQRVLGLFRRLPLLLERNGLRIVHACWDDGMVALLRGETDSVNLHDRHRFQIDQELTTQVLDKIDRELLHQNRNPVKLLTSGPEERSDQHFFSGGKIRNEQRVPWWNSYAGEYCVFGHYALREGLPRNSPAYCVDFGVGHRWKERLNGNAGSFSCRLAALRFPERRVVFDNGETLSL